MQSYIDPSENCSTILSEKQTQPKNSDKENEPEKFDHIKHIMGINKEKTLEMLGMKVDQLKNIALGDEPEIQKPNMTQEINDQSLMSMGVMMEFKPRIDNETCKMRMPFKPLSRNDQSYLDNDSSEFTNRNLQIIDENQTLRMHGSASFGDNRNPSVKSLRINERDALPQHPHVRTMANLVQNSHMEKTEGTLEKSRRDRSYNTKENDAKTVESNFFLNKF